MITNEKSFFDSGSAASNRAQKLKHVILKLIKHKFNNQSKINIRNYELNLNEIKNLGIPFGFKLNGFITTCPKSGYTNSYNKSKSGNPNEFLGQRKDLTPKKMALFVKKFKDGGATILGGCCETRPSHIKAMSEIR